MKLSFRWYGLEDKVSINHIAQIPEMDSIVTAIYDEKVGNAWSYEKICDIKKVVEDAGLKFEVIESVPVHEDIKLGLNTRDELINNYCESIKNLGKAGVKVICYNFMPVFDWTRSDIEYKLPDGSTTLIYDENLINEIDMKTTDLSLPGWDASYTREEMLQVIKQYDDMTEEKLWENLQYFLNKIIPVAEESGVLMAIHPDDPPWSIFGLPRIMTSIENAERFLKLYDSKHNGLTLCTGSFGCSQENDVVDMVDKFSKMDRINFMHLRNVKYTGKRSFEETAHPSSCGNLDMYKIVKVLVKNGFDSYYRPDHGRMIWGETGRSGYGLYDRALGASYLNGLVEAAKKELKNE